MGVDPQCTTSSAAEHLKTVNTAMHILSFLLSGLFTYCNVRDENKLPFPSNMTKMLGLCALGYHSSNIFLGIVFDYKQMDPRHTWASAPGYFALCKSQAITTQLFAFGMFCWWMLISVTVFRLVVHGVPMGAVRRLRRHYYAFGFGGPLLFTGLPLCAGLLGSNSGFFACWVERGDDARWQFALLFGEMGLGVLVSVLWAARIIRRLHAVGKEVEAGGGKHGFLPQMVRHTGFMLTLAGAFALLCWWGVVEMLGRDHPWGLCLANTVNVSTLGTNIALVFLPTRANWQLLSAPLRRLGLLRALPPAGYYEDLASSVDSSGFGARYNARASDDSIGAWGSPHEHEHERPPSLNDDSFGGAYGGARSDVAHLDRTLLDVPLPVQVVVAREQEPEVGRAHYASRDQVPSDFGLDRSLNLGYSREEMLDASLDGSYYGERHDLDSSASLQSGTSMQGLDHSDYSYLDAGGHGLDGVPGDEHYEWDSP